ncbi:hypothetical protein U1Q18_028289, partial [Sarracenia purpurea var. burkii]
HNKFFSSFSSSLGKEEKEEYNRESDSVCAQERAYSFRNFSLRSKKQYFFFGVFIFHGDEDFKDGFPGLTAPVKIGPSIINFY